MFRLRSKLAPGPAFLVLGVFLLFAAVSAAQTPAKVASPATREVVDETGRSVRVPLVPERIVSLAPSLTETVYALGLQDHLVGDTDYCDYPPDAQKKPKVGGVINPNLEEIAALHPDLVLVTKTLNRLDTVRALDTLGIPSYATDPHTVEDILSSTQKLADVLGSPAAGKALETEMRQRLAVLQTKLAGVVPRRVLFIVWTEPLISVGKDTFIADALRKAGAVSIVESERSWPQMSLEEVVRQQPEYLVFAASHSGPADRDFDLLAARPGWGLVRAVQDRRFAVISDAVNRPAPRIISAIEELARQLHPEAFQAAPDSAPAPTKAAPSAKPSPSEHSPSAALPIPYGPSSAATEMACAR